MGRYCRICDSVRPNEAFTGKGHKILVCKRCQRLPVEKRRRIEELDEIWGFMYQSNISEKNLSRLANLAKSSDPKVAEAAGAVLEVGRIHPHKRRRIKFLVGKHRDLVNRLAHAGFDGLYPMDDYYDRPVFDDGPLFEDKSDWLQGDLDDELDLDCWLGFEPDEFYRYQIAAESYGLSGPEADDGPPPDEVELRIKLDRRTLEWVWDYDSDEDF